jgi:hypothetical protein
MLGKDVVDEELKRGFGLSIKEIEPLLRAGGDAAEMKFMECCHYLWKVDGVELIEPFILAVFNKLPEKSRCVLFQRIIDDCVLGTRWRATTNASRMTPPKSIQRAKKNHFHRCVQGDGPSTIGLMQDAEYGPPRLLV